MVKIIQIIRVEYNGAAPDYAINLNSDKVTAANKNAGSNLDRVSSKDGIVTKYSEEPNYDNNNAYPEKMVKRVNYRAAPTYQMSTLPKDEANNVVTGNNNNVEHQLDTKYLTMMELKLNTINQ